MRPEHHPESHLQRARVLLSKGDNPSLFYAALEFRFCVEARLLDYAEHAERFANKKGNPWSAKELSKFVDGVFGDPANVYRIELMSERFPDPIVLEYVPVSSEVRTTLGRIDNFLHYSGVLQCIHEGKTHQLRKLLETGIELMEQCLKGGLQGSLIQDQTGNVQMSIDLSSYPELENSVKNGDPFRIRMRVDPYLSDDDDQSP